MAKDAFPWSVPENDPPLNSNLEVNDARPSLKDRITKNAKLLAPFGLLFVAFFLFIFSMVAEQPPQLRTLVPPNLRS